MLFSTKRSCRQLLYRSTFIYFIIILLNCTCNAHSLNLWQIYNLSLDNDASFQAEIQKYKAIKQEYPISAANLLPLITASSSARRTKYSITNNNIFNTEYEHGLQLSQSIFDWKKWLNLKTTHIQIRQAAIKLKQSSQELMLRVATSYFNILKAQDNLSFIQHEKAAIGQQLKLVKNQYKVGLIPQTDLSEAQAKYDDIQANLISAKNIVKNSYESLRSIIGYVPTKIQSLRKNFNASLSLLNGRNIVSWEKVAQKYNLDILYAIYANNIASQNINLAFADHLPTLELNAGYSKSKTQGQQTNFSSSSIDGSLYNISLNASLPIYSGGRIIHNVQAQKHLFYSSEQQLELSKLNTQIAIRESYRSVLTNFSKIKALIQAVRSSKASLTATTDSFKVGNRTMLDVLNAVSNFYEREKELSQAKYDFLINILMIKKNAGIIVPQDLQQINKYFYATK